MKLKFVLLLILGFLGIAFFALQYVNNRKIESVADQFGYDYNRFRKGNNIPLIDTNCRVKYELYHDTLYVLFNPIKYLKDSLSYRHVEKLLCINPNTKTIIHEKDSYEYHPNKSEVYSLRIETKYSKDTILLEYYLTKRWLVGEKYNIKDFYDRKTYIINRHQVDSLLNIR